MKAYGVIKDMPCRHTTCRIHSLNTTRIYVVLQNYQIPFYETPTATKTVDEKKKKTLRRVSVFIIQGQFPPES